MPVEPVVEQSDLARQYLALQIQYLNRQLEALDRSERETRERRSGEANRSLMWSTAAAPAIVVLLMSVAFGAIVAGLWNPAEAVAGGGRSSLRVDLNQIGAAIRDWSAVVLPLTAAIALLLKRMANRSMFSVAVVVLSGLLGGSVAGLEAIIQKDWFPTVGNSLTDWHVWSILVPAVIVALLVLHLLTEASYRSHGVTHHVGWTGPLRTQLTGFLDNSPTGRIFGWVLRPSGWQHWLASIAIITALCVVLAFDWLLLFSLVYAISGGLTDAVGTGFGLIWFCLFPLGLVWWMLLGLVLASREGFRRPAAKARSMAWFIAIGLGSLLGFSLCAAFYSTTANFAGVILVILGLESLFMLLGWVFWSAAVAPSALRQAFAPLVVIGAGVLFLPGRIALPFATLAAILVVGIPIELWACTRRAAQADLPPAR